MASLQELVDVISEVQQRDRATVNVYARFLREAGLIATGRRGRAPQQMTERDAANLLIGLAASASPKDAVATVRTIRDLPRVPAPRKGDGQSTFGLMLENLISIHGSNEVDTLFRSLVADQKSRALGGADPKLMSMKVLASLFDTMERMGIRVEITLPDPKATIELLGYRRASSTPALDVSPLTIMSYGRAIGEVRYFTMPGDADWKRSAMFSERTISAVAEAMRPK